MFLDFTAGERRGQEYAGITLPIVQVNRDDEFLFGQVLYFGEVRSSPVGEGVPGTVGARATTTDAVRVSEREKRACCNPRGAGAGAGAGASVGDGADACCTAMRLQGWTRIFCNNRSHLLHQILRSTARSLQASAIDSLCSRLSPDDLEAVANIRVS